jgi:hypothetical protein
VAISVEDAGGMVTEESPDSFVLQAVISITARRINTNAPHLFFFFDVTLIFPSLMKKHGMPAL